MVWRNCFFARFSHLAAQVKDSGFPNEMPNPYMIIDGMYLKN